MLLNRNRFEIRQSAGDVDKVIQEALCTRFLHSHLQIHSTDAGEMAVTGRISKRWQLKVEY